MGLDELSKELRELEAGRDRVLKGYASIQRISKPNKSVGLAVFGLILLILGLILAGYMVYLLIPKSTLISEIRQERIIQPIILNNTEIRESIIIESDVLTIETTEYLNTILDKFHPNII
jgi:hypothetical protein